jgi:hypothetical protein
LLSVLAHFFEHEDWGSSLKTGVEEQSLSAEEQLFVLMQAALYLTATREAWDHRMPELVMSGRNRCADL